MKFYKLQTSFKPDKIGFVRFDSKFDTSRLNSATKLTEGAFPDFVPEFPNVLISEKEIYASDREYPRIISHEEGLESDFLYDGGTIRAYGYFISEIVRSVFERFNLSPHRYYLIDTVNEHTGLFTKRRYYYLHILKTDVLEWVDFNYSTLSKINIAEFKYKNSLFKVANKQEYTHLIDGLAKGHRIVFHDVAIKKEYFDKYNYDLMRLRPLFAFDIISESLKEALEDKVSGLEAFSEVNLLVT